MKNPIAPNPLVGKVLDSLRGDVTPAEKAEVEALLARDPSLRLERDRLAAFLALAASAHEVPLDVRASERVAARARERVRRLEDRPASHPRPAAVRWARLLALSVGIHAAVLLTLVLTVPAETRRPKEESLLLDAKWQDESRQVLADNDLGVPVDPFDPLADSRDLPIAQVIRDLPAMGDDRAAALVPDGPSPYGMYLPSVARPMWVRSDAGAKRELLQRLGALGAVEKVQKGLAALRFHQRSDGSFEEAPGHSDVRSTATVLLAFLSDGHSSRSGDYRDVVEKGIAWLAAESLSDPAGQPAAGAKRAKDFVDRALALLVLSEDVMLSSGSLTLAESRSRFAEVEARARSLRDAHRAAGTVPAGWSALALASAARLGIGRGPTLARLEVPAGGPEMMQGTALLLGGRVRDFEAWTAQVTPAVLQRLATDGLARTRADAPLGERLEETALLLLALQVSYRTY